MVLDHLVGFGSLVDVPDVRGDPSDAATERPDRLLKLLNVTIGQTNVIVNVSLIHDERLILKGLFQGFDAFLVLFARVIVETLPVQDRRVVRIFLQSVFKIFLALLVHLNIV